MKPGSTPDQTPPAEPAKSPLSPFFNEIVRQAAPEYQALAGLLVSFRDAPARSDVSKALFHARKLAAVLEEAHRQLAAARKP